MSNGSCISLPPRPHSTASGLAYTAASFRESWFKGSFYLRFIVTSLRSEGLMTSSKEYLPTPGSCRWISSTESTSSDSYSDSLPVVGAMYTFLFAFGILWMLWVGCGAGREVTSSILTKALAIFWSRKSTYREIYDSKRAMSYLSVTFVSAERFYKASSCTASCLNRVWNEASNFSRSFERI